MHLLVSVCLISWDLLSRPGIYKIKAYRHRSRTSYDWSSVCHAVSCSIFLVISYSQFGFKITLGLVTYFHTPLLGTSLSWWSSSSSAERWARNRYFAGHFFSNGTWHNPLESKCPPPSPDSQRYTYFFAAMITLSMALYTLSRSRLDIGRLFQVINSLSKVIIPMLELSERLAIRIDEDGKFQLRVAAQTSRWFQGVSGKLYPRKLHLTDPERDTSI